MIPEAAGHAEIAEIVEVMVQRVAALQPAQVARRFDRPMVDPVMRRHVPKVAQHHSRRKAGGNFNGADEEGGHGHERQKNEESEPNRRANEGLLIVVMHIMLLLDPFDMVEDVAMEQVFNEGPAGDADDNGQNRGHPSMRIAREGQGDAGDSGGWIGIKIGEENGPAQSRGRHGRSSLVRVQRRTVGRVGFSPIHTIILSSMV